jgi:hypothetical protein
MLLSHGLSTSVSEAATPRRRDVHTSRKYAVAICETNAYGGVLQTKAIDSEARNRSSLADTVALV